MTKIAILNTISVRRISDEHFKFSWNPETSTALFRALSNSSITSTKKVLEILLPVSESYGNIFNREQGINHSIVGKLYLKYSVSLYWRQTHRCFCILPDVDT